MTVTLRIPAALRDQAGGVAELTVDASTVAAALAALTSSHPSLRRHLYDESGQLRSFVNVFVNDSEIRSLGGVDAPVSDGDTVLIVPSIAGGDAAQTDGNGDGYGNGLPELTRSELRRYARHLVLPGIGEAGQRRLKAARVLVVGAGGLGSPVGLYLAAAGVGTIGVVDDDVVDDTNLQRQILYGADDVGRRKTEAAAERLRRANPLIRVVEHDARLTSANALDVLAEYDVVVDGTDNFPTRYLLNDACGLLGKPYVYGAILRFEGQVSVFDARVGPCYRCLFREPPPPGLVPGCAEGGVVGVLPGIIGSLQALEVIKLVTGAGETLVGRLALFDALAHRWREVKLRKNPECPLCGTEPTIRHLIDYEAFCAGSATDEMEEQPIPEVTATELKRRLDAGERLRLIDVREPFEWGIANLGAYGAELIPLSALSDRLRGLDEAAPTVFYCRSGARSGHVVEVLRDAGVPNVWNLKGGILAWGREVDPTFPQY